MAEIKREVIEIGDFSPSPDKKCPPLRSVSSLKNRDQIKKFEDNEDCFILEFDPFDDIDVSKLSLSLDSDNAVASDPDLCVIAEKGQLACRDYPHPRHTCVRYPFETTPHDTHCEQCYCYVCDSCAPCEKWVGSSGHCHAFNSDPWEKEKKATRLLLKKTTSDSEEIAGPQIVIIS